MPSAPYQNTTRAGRYGYVMATNIGGEYNQTSGFYAGVTLGCPLTDWEAVFSTEMLDATNFESPRKAVWANAPTPVPAIVAPENTWKQFITGLSEGEIALKGKVHEDWQFFAIGFPVGALVTVAVGFRPVVPAKPFQFIQVDIRVSNGTIGNIVSGTGDFTIKGKMNGAPTVILL